MSLYICVKTSLHAKLFIWKYAPNVYKCVVTENIHAHPTDWLMEMPRGSWVSKAQVFKEKYGTKMEFPEGVGVSS